jgi:hypothetical protein
MATSADPIPDAPHDNRPEIQDALSRPLPDDPKQFHDLWQQLTREENGGKGLVVPAEPLDRQHRRDGRG